MKEKPKTAEEIKKEIRRAEFIANFKKIAKERFAK